eukprot:3281659-Pleurochrysis_carterae.AAC.1
MCLRAKCGADRARARRSTAEKAGKSTEPAGQGHPDPADPAERADRALSDPTRPPKVGIRRRDSKD